MKNKKLLKFVVILGILVMTKGFFSYVDDKINPAQEVPAFHLYDVYSTSAY